MKEDFTDDDDDENNNSNHNHIAITELGRLLTFSGLIYQEVSNGLPWFFSARWSVVF
jgi:hypothetical protein